MYPDPKFFSTNLYQTLKFILLYLLDAPDPPCNIKLGELQDDGSLVISWDPPKYDGGNPIKHYCLQVRLLLEHRITKRIF